MKQMKDGTCGPCTMNVVDKSTVDHMKQARSCYKGLLELKLGRVHLGRFNDFHCFWGGCSTYFPVVFLMVTEVLTCL